MASNPFIRALSLARFDEFARLQGLDSAQMLRQVPLPAASLHRPDDILSFRQYCSLLDMCRQRSGNALFGLEYGVFQGIEVFGDIFHLIRNTRTVGDALQELRASYSFYNGAAEIGLEVVDGLVLLSYQTDLQAHAGLFQAEELACGVGLRLMRTLAGSAWQAEAVMLRHSALADESTYRLILGVTPNFGATHTGLLFDASVLTQPLGCTDETLHQLIAQHLCGMERLSPDELLSYIRQLLRNLLPSGR